ncbi:MAG TPA: phosphoenolpyruvate synthase, partial [Bacteroidales bacterium]|nr:phosphoenolpyruvate synthase [Bacteroidales bacterium]
NLNPSDIRTEDTLLISRSSLGNGIIKGISDLVYIRPESFDPAKSHDIAARLDKINARFMQEKRYYVLVGPGRWGSSDPWLGMPVKWPQICNARLIVESGLDHYRIDPSQGTHFFQNLTSFRVGYFTINPFINEGFYDLEFLNAQPAFYEDEYIRHIRFNAPIRIELDGRKNFGVVYKP